MKTLRPRSFYIHSISTSSLSAPRLSLLFLHSIAGDGAPALRRKSNPFPSWLGTFFHSFNSSSRKHDEEHSKKLEIQVFWDFENCNIPDGVNVFRVAHRIKTALLSKGIDGPVTITAFGDVSQLSRNSQIALISTGVHLSHVPNGKKNNSDRFLMAHLLYWVQKNPPPAHFFLISGDSDFAIMLQRLRMSNYNILLACKDSSPGVLLSVATFMWSWPCLVKGERATVKQFNHPPNSLYGGHHKAVLHDPFSTMDQAAQNDESMKLTSESKPRKIPKDFVNAIRQILYSYPEGISVSELRTELKRINIIMDKDFFGYKKFSHLLASMPSVLKLIPNASLESQPLVVGTHRRTTDSPPSVLKPNQDVDASDGEKSHTPKQNEKHPSTTLSTELDPASTICGAPANQKEIDLDSSENVSIHTQEHVTDEQTFLGSEHHKKETFFSNKGNDMKVNDYVPTSEQRKNISVERGFLQMIWKVWNGTSASDPVGGVDNISELSHEDFGKAESHSICRTTKKSKTEDKAAKLKNNFSSEPKTIPSFMETVKSFGKDKTIGLSQIPSGSPDTKESFFSQIASWLIFWKSGKHQQIISAPQKQVIADKENHTESNNNQNNTIKPSLLGAFSKGYFLDALESFFLTSEGADLILKSRTREELVHGLQKDGPWVLKDLTEAEYFELVNSMIVEKKWLEESNSQMFPFKLSLAKQECAPSLVHSSNGLSSLFMGRSSKSNMHKQVEQERLGHNSRLVGRPFDQTIHSKPPQNFVDLRFWFQRVYKGFEDVEPEDLQKLFESKFNTKLISSNYGHPNLQSLIVACLADDDDYCLEKSKSSPSREKILSDCQKLLVELLNEYPDGFNMSIFKSAFSQRYDYTLDVLKLGYPKLSSFLQIMPGVRIESSFIIPVESFGSDSSWSSKPVIETLDHSLHEDKGAAIHRDNGGESSTDSAWEELGPVSETAIKDGTTADQAKDGATYEEVSLSDESFSDSEDDSHYQLEEPEGKSNRWEEDSSLLQILDSWYGSKEVGVKQQVQSTEEDAGNNNSPSKEGSEEDQGEAVDGLVDCSKSITHDGLADCSKIITQTLVDVNPTDKQKVKVRPSKRYNFVSEQPNEKEKLVESILDSLKKAGSSKMHS
ncbi:hypothetical protein Cni_G24314 [Canna indica]|uniref:HTH OST-type domain-containing protein n=1 Tax=Canna indica TaxID=4628 RepID=A0AAQ3KYU0_9LILI|nr:hypothetical protein Cni_G24314 [Canna indica]